MATFLFLHIGRPAQLDVTDDEAVELAAGAPNVLGGGAAIVRPIAATGT